MMDPKYGKLGKDGLPIDPGLGMNSKKISENERLELHQPLPKGYHIVHPIRPRCVSGKAKDVEWRSAGAGRVFFSIPNEELLARTLGLQPQQIPPGIRGTSQVLKSPSGQRVIANAGVSDVLFQANNGVVDISSEKKIHSVNFDDKRRAFINWNAFASESLIVGLLSDDEEIENLPSRQILYTYDIDRMILRRVIFPKSVQKEEWQGFFVIDDVAASAVLLRWEGQAGLMTVYLDP